ncbi:subtilisin-like protein [Viridothelium virens]|uniref:Subtilisin-like protein n=1 Tax=Viridothelium virens TaxID=1048519 RepID=A0A6A6H7I6_VIRVR|nr:subtilisin-like protein [Viridothelium virens]
MSQVEAPADAQSIEVNGRIVNPSEHYARDARNTDHIILTVEDTLNDDQKAQLQKLQVEFLEDLGNGNILCRYHPADLKPLRGLKFVKQVDVYRNLYKIPAVLLALIDELKGTAEFETQSYPMDVMPHQEVTDLEALADSVAEIAQADRSQIRVTSNQIRLEVPLGKLEAIAADDRVRILEEVVTPVLLDDQAKHIVSAPIHIQGDSEFRGKGQTIAVFDSGFDLGSVEDCHPAFTGKVQKLIPVGRASDMNRTESQRVDDPKGHGTHVCGTIVGQEIKTSQGSVGGVAQDASLVISSLEKADGDLISVAPLKALYEVPYKTYGARVHSNSWGDGLGIGRRQRPYGKAAADIDEFVRNNPDALICFSAGNNNLYMNEREPSDLQLPSIGSQAAAKNCLTVGASGSTRTVEDPKNGKVDWLDPDQICPVSSRGPTAEKRIKPDVVAPGFNIFSAHSRHPRAKTFSGAEATSESYPEVLWKIRSGTSHATPLVSGCIAILCEVLQSKGCQNPPAALLKALMINGADKLPSVDIAAQGFGRINLQSSVSILQAPPVMAKDINSPSLSPLGGSLIGSPLRQGDKVEFSLAPAPFSDGIELKITMVYNDLSGSAIQNNLNLSVTDSVTGEIKHGGISEDAIDKQNNVEQVVWSPAPQVPVTVRVIAQKTFPGSEQDFVLAWSVSASYGGSNKDDV